MRYRRLITALTLIAFLPVSAGCSKSRTIGVVDEPVDSSSRSKLLAGEPVEISGYTRKDDGFRAWDGFVRLAESDDLEFTARTSPGAPAAVFVLHASEVTSINAVEADTAGTTVLVVVSVLAAGIAIAVATWSAAMSDFGD